MAEVSLPSLSVGGGLHHVLASHSPRHYSDNNRQKRETKRRMRILIRCWIGRTCRVFCLFLSCLILCTKIVATRKWYPSIYKGFAVLWNIYNACLRCNCGNVFENEIRWKPLTFSAKVNVGEMAEKLRRSQKGDVVIRRNQAIKLKATRYYLLCTFSNHKIKMSEIL